ncbi:hypothetical protein EOD41_08990 [Mucilaginibacter limnophilus]|uniref:Uncharacterized protein n=1 Tax=Mucilaginibacter limnophilus TaxID=1932778 RepID=A0A3S2V9L7_9SPHI|nr:hypothetical protein [Mucilaginibacter limnophilus]RVU02073.1 hypothetical protein EOD41_08990 [Mucilaginibacter limnophilus]
MLADFYDSDGSYLGDDEVKDNKVYVVNYGARANKENKSVNWGGKLSAKHSSIRKTFRRNKNAGKNKVLVG